MNFTIVYFVIVLDMWRRKKLHHDQFIRHTFTFVCFAIVSIIFKMFFWGGLFGLVYGV